MSALSLDELRKDPKLTPARFASYFANFKYHYLDEVQDPEMFLTSRIGDCDDFATVADLLLREKGYHTHLIAVRMPGLVHVVCYVDEIKGYLDFNNRAYLRRVVSCDKTVLDVARKVAKSFDANWTSASEFTFQHGMKQLVSTIAQTEIYGGSKAEEGRIPPGMGAEFKPMELR